MDNPDNARREAYTDSEVSWRRFQKSRGGVEIRDRPSYRIKRRVRRRNASEGRLDTKPSTRKIEAYFYLTTNDAKELFPVHSMLDIDSNVLL